MLRDMLCNAVLRILWTRVEGCHGDGYLDYVSYDLSKHPQVCSLDTWGSLRKKLLSYTRHPVSQVWILNVSPISTLQRFVQYSIKAKATSGFRELYNVTYILLMAKWCQQCEVRTVDSNASKICHDFSSLSRLRGCNPSELKSLRPLGPGSAEIKLCAQSWGKGGQGPNGGWGTGQWLQ